MNHWLRLTGILAVWSCLTTVQAVDFVQLTDPHIYDGKPTGAAANKVALQWAIDRINADMAANRTVDFVVITGDLGIEGLKTDESRKSAAQELGAMLKRSAVDRWFLVPGNNDLDDEDPATIGHYRRFVDEVKKTKSGAADLCARPNDRASGVFAAEGCRFIGFNNTSCKANGQAAGALRFEQEQLQEIAQINARLAAPDFKHAYLFYHLPDIDDPYYELLAGSEPDHPDLVKRAAEQKSLGYSNAKSAWLVTGKVRQEWSATLSNPRLGARFAGHFHSPLRGKYGLRADATSGGSGALFVCPPLAGRWQENSKQKARGFLRVSMDSEKNKISAEPVWYGDVVPSP